MLKSILTHLLQNSNENENYRRDTDFRLEVLKNRVDQLCIENSQQKKQVETINKFRETTKEVFEDSRKKDDFLKRQISKMEENMTDIDKYIMSSSEDPTGGNKEGLLKLISSKAEHKLNDK